MADKSWESLVDNEEEWAKAGWNDPRLNSFAAAAEKQYGLPTGVLNALKYAERTPAPESGRRTESPKGAKGIMQFMDSTRQLQGGVFDHNPADPLASIDAAAKYMVRAIKQYDGNVLAAVADYNGGPRQAKAVVNGEDPPAAETQKYLQNVRNYMEAYMQHLGKKGG